MAFYLKIGHNVGKKSNSHPAKKNAYMIPLNNSIFLYK